MASETTFYHWKVTMKSEENSIFSKPSNVPIVISWKLILYTFLGTKIKKITIANFFPLMHVQDPLSHYHNCVLSQLCTIAIVHNNKRLH